jgi:hypothetical protein
MRFSRLPIALTAMLVIAGAMSDVQLRTNTRHATAADLRALTGGHKIRPASMSVLASNRRER